MNRLRFQMIIYRFQVIQVSRDPSLSIFMLLEPYDTSSPPYIELKWNFTVVGSETSYPLMKTLSLINRSSQRTQRLANQHFFFPFESNGRKCDLECQIHGVINIMNFSEKKIILVNLKDNLFYYRCLQIFFLFYVS